LHQLWRVIGICREDGLQDIQGKRKNIDREKTEKKPEACFLNAIPDVRKSSMAGIRGF
jgi:hypothetical protein